MTQTYDSVDVTVSKSETPSPEQIDVWTRENLFIPVDEATPDVYPRLWNISAGFMFTEVIRPTEPASPEYFSIPMDYDSLELAGAVGRWNVLWESAQFRRRFFDEQELPGALGKIADVGDVNAVILPRTRTRYYEYSPLLHMLPRRTLERFGLPLLRGGQWPYLASFADVDRHLPADFETRLSRAWASQVWPHLISGSPLNAFSGQDPIRLLAHNLDFWIPAATTVIQEILGDFPQVDKGVVAGPVTLIDGSLLKGAVTGNPRMGGDVWRGEVDAAEALAWTVEEADGTGRLTGIIDAVRSNRVADDFSSRWSYAREDFERKLYRKRDKVKVRFVELTDTIPVQGPESEVVGNLVTNDFMALLDERQRQIVVLLSSGVTKQQEIAERLGYANHAPISKRLTQIRKLALEHFADI